MSFDDFLALLGLIFFLSGLYMWLGAAATLMLLGLVLIYIGARIDTRKVKNERNQTTDKP